MKVTNKRKTKHCVRHSHLLGEAKLNLKINVELAQQKPKYWVRYVLPNRFVPKLLPIKEE